MQITSHYVDTTLVSYIGAILLNLEE